MSIICTGELLIDFISQNIGNNLCNSDMFLKKAGGAPANVSAVISRLGGKGLFCGKVGDDSFGEFLEKSLISHGVDCSLLYKDKTTSLYAGTVDKREAYDEKYNLLLTKI